MALNLVCGDEVTIQADGENESDEENVVLKLIEFITSL